ncbi:MAG: DNA alkylation repair protein [Algicola sp.]|nr:DNA alkylation repair protein [Algicola sp.]
MPEPLKNAYNQAFIQSLCDAVKAQYAPFDVDNFQLTIFDGQWDAKELKERMSHISKTLQQFLPPDYRQALAILKPVAANYCRFEYMFFPGFVELFGLDDYEASIEAMAFLTQYSSAEFAVRPFIKRYPERMMAQMLEWAGSDNYHIRRLATEGCRPRLPWAMALPDFKKDPQLVLKILEKLKLDDSEYVRRSVANNLNDISKDNPELLIKLAGEWHGQHPHTDRIVKHACRTLLKQGEARVLALFGFMAPEHVKVEAFELQKTVKMGETLAYSFELSAGNEPLGRLRIEYAVDFMKSNGKQARKVFKVAESDYQQSTKQVSKRYSFKPISTRKYYPGAHGLAVIVNGHELARGSFELQES